MRGFLLVLIFLMFGCSAQWHLHRAIRKNPNLFDSTMVVQIDTVKLPRPEPARLIFNLNKGTDTISYINRMGVEINIYKRGMAAEVECKCPPPILITKNIETKVIVTMEPKWVLGLRKTFNIGKWVLLGLGVLFVFVKYALPKLPFIGWFT